MKALKQVDIELLALEYDWTDPDCFTNHFQRHDKPGEVCLSVGELKTAYENSQYVCDQYETKSSKVAELSIGIFKEDRWLKTDLIVGKSKQGDYFLLDGRHRLLAIIQVLGLVGDELGIGTQILDQLVRIELFEGVEIEEVPELVIAYNESRNITKAEAIHIRLSKLQVGGDSKDLVRKVLTGGYTNKDMMESLANYFVRKPQQVIKSNTVQKIGEGLAKYILFGKKKRVKDGAVSQITVDEFCAMADKLWGYVEEYAAQEVEKARHYSDFIKYAISRFEAK